MLAEENAAELRWKNKFLASVDETEREEKIWRQTERSLLESLSNLALSGYGLDRGVDKLLDELRSTVRSRLSSESAIKLAKRIHLASADLTRDAQTPGSGPPPTTELIQLLRLLPLEGKLAKCARRLENQLLKAGTDPKSNIVELSALVRGALALLTSEDPVVQQPDKTRDALHPIKRLFARSPKVQDNRPAPTYDALLDQVSQRIAKLDALAIDLGAWQTRLSTLKGETDPAPVAQLLIEFFQETQNQEFTRSGEILIQLLQRLELPHQFQENIESMHQRLSTAQSDQAVPQVIDELADLVDTLRSGIDQERRGMEEYLARLTSRLGNLDNLLGDMGTERTESLNQGDALSVRVHQQVGELHQEVHTATDLESLKSKVNERIERLGTQMTGFLRQERENAERDSHRIHDLKGQVADLEVQTLQLGERLAEQRKASQLDGLTGVNNRASFETELSREYDRWRRYQQPLSLLFWDIDKCKAVNDTYGHQAGDKIIQTVAKILESQSRNTDFLARYGGEEFVMLLPETSLSVACEVAEQLRAALEAAKFRYKGANVPITASCGVAEFAPTDEPHQLVERADKALYEAKQTGRNRVVAG